MLGRKGQTYFIKSNPKIIQACNIIREVLFEHLAKEGEIVKNILQRR